MMTANMKYTKIASMQKEIAEMQNILRARIASKSISGQDAHTYTKTIHSQIRDLTMLESSVKYCSTCGAAIGECDGYCDALPNELDDESEYN